MNVSFGTNGGLYNVRLVSLETPFSGVYWLCGSFQKVEGIDLVTQAFRFGPEKILKGITIDGATSILGSQESVNGVIKKISVATLQATGKATVKEEKLILETGITLT